MTHDIRNVLNELLVDIFNQILDLEERYHKEHGIKLLMSEIHTLEAIDKSTSKTMSDVARVLQITQGTLTVNVNRLTNKGYVYRVQDEKDRRIYRIKLTDKAKEVMKVHTRFHIELVDELIGSLNADEVETLTQSLGQVNLYFRKLMKP